MGNKVVTLNDYRRSKVVIPQINIEVPQLYRVTGFGYHFGEEQVFEDGKYRTVYYLNGTNYESKMVFYTMDDAGHPCKMEEIEFEQIDHLDPEIDKGWIVIRHHRTEESLDGYIWATLDLDHQDFFDNGPIAYRTEQGIFSLVHRAAIRGRPDHLVCVSAQIPERKPNPFSDGWEFWERVIGPNGEELNPDEVLLLPERD